MIDYLKLTNTLGIVGYVRGDEYRSKCPLHADRNPSFSVNTKTGVWICFRGCGKGTFFELVERVYNMSPAEARAWVLSSGKDVGVEIAAEDFQAAMAKQFAPKSNQPFIVPDWVLFWESLVQDRMPKWFLDRGITWGTINHWDIRYSPIFDSVTIPVKWNGNLVGLVTRNTIKEPKYENSPDLPRSEILFGEINANRNDIMVCEGAIDLLWLWQNGYNAFGLLGSSLSQRQAELLREYHFGEIILAYDNDKAGKDGTKKATDLLFANGWMPQQITQITFPLEKDPNDCSTELLKELYDSRRSAFQFSIQS